jgi:hypothetical protein
MQTKGEEMLQHEHGKSLSMENAHCRDLNWQVVCVWRPEGFAIDKGIIAN